MIESVYLAARYSRRNEMIRLRAKLKELEISVTSRWMDKRHETSSEMWTKTEDEKREEFGQFAREDLQDIRFAQTLILFTENEHAPKSRGGRFVEFGYAMALYKPIIIVGPRENAFCWAHGLRWYIDTEIMLNSIKHDF